MQKIIWLLKAHISVMAGHICLKFGIECVLPQGTYHSKNGVVLLRHCRVTDAWKWHFLGSCIMHTCQSRTHIGCAWPLSRHTTVYLDSGHFTFESVLLSIVTAMSTRTIVWAHQVYSGHFTFESVLLAIVTAMSTRTIVWAHQVYLQWFKTQLLFKSKNVCPSFAHC